ncbi:unnamed protein product [Amoebophrya sp. A120]|nr:unnamed protein product [Amoebophrya sp. A120]|eukprot:GSA120T00015194001.1
MLIEQHQPQVPMMNNNKKKGLVTWRQQLETLHEVESPTRDRSTPLVRAGELHRYIPESPISVTRGSPSIVNHRAGENTSPIFPGIHGEGIVPTTPSSPIQPALAAAGCSPAVAGELYHSSGPSYNHLHANSSTVDGSAHGCIPPQHLFGKIGGGFASFEASSGGGKLMAGPGAGGAGFALSSSTSAAGTGSSLATAGLRNNSHLTTRNKTTKQKPPVRLANLVVDMPKVDPLAETTASLVLNQAEAERTRTTQGDQWQDGDIKNDTLPHDPEDLLLEEGESRCRVEGDEQCRNKHLAASGGHGAGFQMASGTFAPSSTALVLEMANDMHPGSLLDEDATSATTAGVRKNEKTKSIPGKHQVTPDLAAVGSSLGGSYSSSASQEELGPLPLENDKQIQGLHKESAATGSRRGSAASGTNHYIQGNKNGHHVQHEEQSTAGAGGANRKQKFLDTYRKNFPKEFTEKSKRTIRRLDKLIQNSDRVFQNTMEEITDAMLSETMTSTLHNSSFIKDGLGVESSSSAEHAAGAAAIVSGSGGADTVDDVEEDVEASESTTVAAVDGGLTSASSSSNSASLDEHVLTQRQKVEQQKIKTAHMQKALPHHRRDPTSNWSPIDRMLFIKKQKHQRQQSRLEPIPSDEKDEIKMMGSTLVGTTGLGGGSQEVPTGEQQLRTWKSVGVQTLATGTAEDRKRLQLEELLAEQARTVTSLESARQGAEDALRQQEASWAQQAATYQEQATIQQNTIDTVKHMLQQVMREHEQERAKLEKECAEERAKHRDAVLRHQTAVKELTQERDNVLNLKAQAEEERDRVMVSLETEQALLLARVETLQQQMRDRNKRDNGSSSIFTSGAATFTGRHLVSGDSDRSKSTAMMKGSLYKSPSRSSSKKLLSSTLTDLPSASSGGQLGLDIVLPDGGRQGGAETPSTATAWRHSKKIRDSGTVAVSSKRGVPHNDTTSSGTTVNKAAVVLETGGGRGDVEAARANSASSQWSAVGVGERRNISAASGCDLEGTTKDGDHDIDTSKRGVVPTAFKADDLALNSEAIGLRFRDDHQRKVRSGRSSSPRARLGHLHAAAAKDLQASLDVASNTNNTKGIPAAEAPTLVIATSNVEPRRVSSTAAGNKSKAALDQRRSPAKDSNPLNRLGTNFYATSERVKADENLHQQLVNRQPAAGGRSSSTSTSAASPIATRNSKVTTKFPPPSLAQLSEQVGVGVAASASSPSLNKREDTSRCDESSKQIEVSANSASTRPAVGSSSTLIEAHQTASSSTSVTNLSPARGRAARSALAPARTTAEVVDAETLEEFAAPDPQNLEKNMVFDKNLPRRPHLRGGRGRA